MLLLDGKVCTVLYVLFCFVAGARCCWTICNILRTESNLMRRVHFFHRTIPGTRYPVRAVRTDYIKVIDHFLLAHHTPLGQVVLGVVPKKVQEIT